MFSKILIANRGEIAVRIIRACRELGIRTVAVYSEVDKKSLHTELADEAICIGPSKGSDSYLNEKNILSAAIGTKSEAIHPGFGFLSENSRFASMCEECNIVFIGPKSEVIDKMGNKLNARYLFSKENIPIIPGSSKVLANIEDALEISDKIGYPVMLKSTCGGGGKGIRKIFSKEDLIKHFPSAQKESKSSFGNDDMYIEKIIHRARHIEVQIIGDKFGNVIHLGERDCSLQRNNQKLLEESPSIVITNEERKKIGQMAIRAAKAIKYQNVGTIEFLMDTKKNFYFMEMNTRIQVEHPITEMVTGIDLVKKQIEIASGQPLGILQKDIQLVGHAIECRINAEDPKKNFLPSSGKIIKLLLPSGGLGIRVDSALYPGYTVPPYYDSMIAKVIVHGKNRFEALMKMQRALGEIITEGIVTNTDFHLDLITHPKIISGEYNTRFLEEKFLKNWRNEALGEKKDVFI